MRPSDMSHQQNRRVLVIDDQASIREDFEKILGKKNEGSAGLDDARSRPHEQLAVVAIHDQQVARADRGHRRSAVAEDRQIEGAGQDRDMGHLGRLRKDHGGDAGGVVIQELRRTQLAGDDHRVLRQLRLSVTFPGAQQVAQQPGAKIVQIGQAFAQSGVIQKP